LNFKKKHLPFHRYSPFYILSEAGRLFILLTGLLISCGKTSVSIDKSTYEPKIVIIGYLYPEKPVTAIRISRNFPIGTMIDKENAPLSTADVHLTDIAANMSYPLYFNSALACFEYIGTDLFIDYGKAYRLDVSASIDNNRLTASAVTVVPEKGLKIIREQSIYGDLFYRQKDERSMIISPRVAFEQSPDASFYLLSISALNAGLGSFIYENPFGFDIQDALDGGATINDFKYRAKWTRPENKSGNYSIIEINWFLLWFYGSQRLILYAGDQNFYHFYNTHRNVQEIDGNLHEPLFDIDGDGIGVFGSAITDTLFLNILPN
jgi:hypothetical protein